MPAGEIARHALPGQGAREQSAGVTLAGRVPTTTEGGGGGSAFCLGGGGARRWEGPPARVTLVLSPAVGGGRAHLCETEAGWGAGWRDHLSGDLRGPGSPCFQPPLPRDRGGGYVLCGGGVRGGGGGGDYVWSIPWCPSLCPVCRRPRGMVGGGVQAWAGRVGSGGRPRRRRRHAGAGPVAVAGRCGRTGRRPAVALRAPLHEVAGRAGGTRAAQTRPWGARVQGRRRARCGPLCGPRDQRQAGSVAWGPRPGPGAWVAAGGRGRGGAMRVRGQWRPRGGAGGPAGGRRRP